MVVRLPSPSAARLAVFFAASSTTMAASAPLRDPPAFHSQRGALNLVMVAQPAPEVLTPQVTTNAWVYHVCQRTEAQQTSCPANSAHPLGGVRLQLNPGDTLHIRLVNKLPPIPEAKHIADNPVLIGNPTNLHTHGLIVEPHRAEGPTDPYGDYVFVEVRNPANPIPTTPTAKASAAAGAHATHATGHPDMDVAVQAVDYAIQIPPRHPSGLFWFHPHVHGVALNQVTAGLSGMITIGAPEDVCADRACTSQMGAGGVRYLALKDMQVLADNSLKTQQDPAFCGAPPTGSPQGLCPGAAVDGGGDYTGGAWLHTVNGQVFPSIHVGPAGDVWRLLNSSGSRSYELWLGDDATNTPVLLQVLSIDGVTIDSLALDGPGREVMARLMGGKVRPVPCPHPAGGDGPAGLCTTKLRLMPSARAEIRVVPPPKSTAATLHTDLYFTGGDSWPAIDLAHVTFTPAAAVLPPLALGSQGRDTLTATGVLMAPTTLRPHGSLTLTDIAGARASAKLPVGGSASHGNLVQAVAIAIDPELKLGLRDSPDCVRLPANHRRRIYFGDPTPGVDGFGLAYVEVDEHGQEIPSTRKAMASFDPASTTVCVPLGNNGRAVKEVWELINLTGEDHNFHIHQTRFRLLQGGTIPGTTIPRRAEDGLVLHDNVPLPRAVETDACDGSVEHFLNGQCQPTTVVVEIPFREVGDFVYHCHILEHEDGGMMARIRVVAPRG